MKQIMLIISFAVAVLSGCGATENSEMFTEALSQVQSEISETEQNKTEENVMYIKIGDNILEAELAYNSSAEALKEMLSNGDVTIEMSDYANFEKVGSLGESLPRNDEQITTEAGDLILYQGNSFVIYYDTNSWNFTRLGKITGVTSDELKNILGSGDVTVTLTLEK